LWLPPGGYRNGPEMVLARLMRYLTQDAVRDTLATHAE
jgi:hypothetical protein